MSATRIPTLSNSTRDAAKKWLRDMHQRELLCHPDDNPCELVQIRDGSPTFTPEECKEVTQVFQRMFMEHGDVVYELAFDVVSSTFHSSTERGEMTILHG